MLNRYRIFCLHKRCLSFLYSARFVFITDKPIEFIFYKTLLACRLTCYEYYIILGSVHVTANSTIKF